MFDPSKLNLDLENLDKKPEDNNESSALNNQEQTEKLEKQKEENTTTSQETQVDILAETNVSSEDEGAGEVSETDSETSSEGQELEGSEEVEVDPETSSEGQEQDEESAEKDPETSSGGQEEDNADLEGENEAEEEKIVFDINITSISDLINYLNKKEYDFFTIEPSEDKAKVGFRKDNIEKEVKYIKYPVYSQILLKAKSITKLQVEETDKSQEGKTKVKIGQKNYKLLSKTVPSAFGEKLFFKVEEIKAEVKKEVKKTSLGTIFSFLGAILFIALVLGGAFITFVVLNAKTVEDVAFFNSLGVNLNDINTFIETSVSIIFSIIMFIEVVLLVIFLFKFALTKKEFKKQRVSKAIVSFILLIVTFSTASGWMFIDRKIKDLPNWLEESYGNVKIYDNDKLLSEFFDENSAIMQQTTNLIGPITIKYDLTNFLNKENKNGFKIKKFVWDFGGKEVKETVNPSIIKTFEDIGTFDVNIRVIEEDLNGKQIEKAIEGVDTIEISNIIKIDEQILDDGGKIVKFDATSLKDLGKLDWYFITAENKDKDLDKAYTGYSFFPKTIFEETLIGVYIQRADKTDETLDKTFIIFPEQESTIGGEIVAEADPIVDLDYTLSVKDAETEFGNGFIEEFIWTIDGKQIVKSGTPDDPELSSKIEYSFKEYGDHDIQVELVDSSGSKKVLKDTIKISKILKLKNNIVFYNNGDELGKNEVRYEEKTNEYYIKDLGVPTSLTIDASDVEASNFLYSLSKIEWDTDLDGNSDSQGDKLNYKIDTAGNKTIEVKYTFINRKIKDDEVVLKETIYITADKKDAILSLEMNYNSDYAPVSVAFDASKSQIKDKDIVKFIFDYGDGTDPEERDAINPGHKYLKAGDYDVTLTVITSDGDEYSTTKKLILKPEAQRAEIKVSLKEVPIYQGIDFSSENSNGQISSYFWDFGDGETSTQANPTHSYKKPGVYKVKLTLDFSNKNSLSDEIEVTITE